jgi:DHA1 family multidrug resistance protein B-like MFS transporter
MKFKEFHSNVKTRIYIMFIFGIAQAMTFPFMAIYFAKYYGNTFTGLFFTVSIIASIISGAISGYYADKVGRKKLLVAAEIVFFSAFVLTALANSPWLTSPAITAVTFFIINVSFGVYGPVDDAMLLDVTTSENRQFMYQIFYWGHNLTMAVGTALGAYLFEKYRFVLFCFVAFAVLCSLLSTIFIIVDTYDPKKAMKKESADKKPRKTGFVHNYLHVFKDVVFMSFVTAGTLLMVLEFQMSNYIGIRLSKEVKPQDLWFLHIDGIKMLGFLQTENTVVVVILAALVAKLIKRFPDHWVLYSGCLMFTLGYSIITTSSTPLLLFGAMLFATVGEVMRVPVQQSYIGDIAPVHSRSSYMAINGMTYQVARVLASLGVLLGGILSSFQMGMVAFFVGLAGILLYKIVMPKLNLRRHEIKAQEQGQQMEATVPI